MFTIPGSETWLVDDVFRVIFTLVKDFAFDPGAWPAGFSDYWSIPQNYFHILWYLLFSQGSYSISILSDTFSM